MTPVTRWPRRRESDFATKFRKDHLEAIESRVPGLAKDLISVRRAWQSDFWAKAPIEKAAAEQPLTKEQIRHLREAIAELSGDDYATAMYDRMEVLVERGYASTRELLDVEAKLSDVVPVHAMNALREHVDDFAFMVNNREQTYLNQLLDTGLSEGWTPGKLSSEISQAFADGYHVLNDKGEIERVIPTDSWSDMVARTELSRAQIMGQVAMFQDAGIQKVMFVTTQGGNVCDECGEYDGEEYDLADAPEIPVHPNCCCSYMAADEDVKYDVPDTEVTDEE